MIWAQWVIVGLGALGALLLVPLGIRLFRQLKAFGALLGRASSTLAEATAGLEAAQSSDSARSRGEARDSALHFT